ncbi:nuclear transport factor 2 family protein [Fischerella sp. PCC 9605]|uniref:nuclear transport factor 2 family protein n=1 Tax=Fischerella sp. PCC 9605 TaxID=1173024 RepID=UPI000686047E|nr:nuclear transport factor 2 family protein [Fischerella sp. PCC 9605]
MNTKITHLPLEVIRNDEAKALDPKDAIAVHELLNRVFLAEDSRDADALRQCVTADLSHHHSLYGALHGREAFVNWVLSNPQFFDGLRHQALNVVTSSEGSDKGRAVSYVLVFQLFSADEALTSFLPRLIAHGIVRDRIVKEDGNWRIAERIYDQFSVLGSLIADSTLRSKASEHLSL